MQVVILLGSNSENKYEVMTEASRRLSLKGQIRLASSFYETEPWGFECSENFLNQALALGTTLSPHEFLGYCLETERQLGRIRKNDGPRYSSRPIDIDIIFCDDCILNTPDLMVPHPRMCERRFVLTPLAEILPDFIHPIYRKSIAELLELCPDRLRVEKIVPPTVHTSIVSNSLPPPK